MSIVTRLLIVVVVFLAATAAVYIIDNSLGIERGNWQDAISVGVIVAATSYAWRLTAPSRPQSN
jgi:hypothetical protein